MSRLTLRLPESLNQALTRRARAEGVSLNQLIVYQLARMTTAADLEEQRRIFEDLRHRYPPQEAEKAGTNSWQRERRLFPDQLPHCGRVTARR